MGFGVSKGKCGIRPITAGIFWGMANSSCDLQKYRSDLGCEILMEQVSGDFLKWNLGFLGESAESGELLLKFFAVWQSWGAIFKNEP